MMLLTIQATLGRREQPAEQAIMAQQLEGLDGAAAHEQRGSRRTGERAESAPADGPKRCSSASVAGSRPKPELGGEPHGPQHPHGVLVVTFARIADQPDQTGFKIVMPPA